MKLTGADRPRDLTYKDCYAPTIRYLEQQPPGLLLWLIIEHDACCSGNGFPTTWWWGERVVGGDGGEGPPGPIPNPVAKLPSADGTALDRVWESKTPPTHSLREGPCSG